ncbi:MAG: GNAT family N-acetyltransferase [Crocinitomicaceae bacterium]
MDYPNLIFETDRLLIRPFKLADIEPAYMMNLDAEVSLYTGDGGIVSKDETKRRIIEDVFGDYKKYGYGRLAVELKSEKKFIGFTGLKYLEDLKTVDLGFRFMKDYWGKGIATESAKACIDFGFNALHLNEIIAMVLPDNKGSVNVLKKLNFKYEKEFQEDNLMVNLYKLEPNVIIENHRKE